MKNYLNKCILLLAMFAMASCKKEDKLNANLDAIDRNQPANIAVDTWLNTNYLVPYNIEVKYRWDATEVDFSKDLTPPKEDAVIPAMEAVRDLWIKPYEKVGGADFMKVNSPKQFILVGSAQYNPDGTITLGNADGGRKIALFALNNFSKTNRSGVKSISNLLYHEFTHILNQKLAYQTSFGLVTRGGYSVSWYLSSTDESRSLGFITPYARSSPIEDFAEMVCNMIVLGRPAYDAIVNALPNDPRTKLRNKEQLVVQYFKTAWNIDFYALQSAAQDAIDNLAPILLKDLIGSKNVYTNFTAKPLDEPQSADFLSKFNAANAALAPKNAQIYEYSFTYQDNNIVTLRYTFSYYGDPDYYGEANYSYTIDSDGITQFTLISKPGDDGNMDFLRRYVTALDGYIQNNKFKIDWAPGIDKNTKGKPGARGAFYKVTDPTSYMIGTLN